MQKTTQFIEQFNRARKQLRELLPQVDRHMEIYPGWTTKEVLAHLAGWDDATIFALQAFAAGEPLAMTAARGIDYYNSQTVAERKELDYEQIVREWEWVRGQLIPLLEQLTEENLATKIATPWGEILPVEIMIKIMIDHEEEHTEIIRERLAHPGQPPQAH